MKVFVICSKKFYSYVPDIKKQLEDNDIEVVLPNCYDDPSMEENMRNLGEEEHKKFKAEMYKKSEKIISEVDAVLVLNYDKIKDGEVLEENKNYIGGATFLEIYDAFRLGKKIYLYNEIPKGILYDEIEGFSPILIKGDLSKIRKDSVATTGYAYVKKINPLKKRIN